MKNFLDHKRPNVQLFQQFYWLPENFDNWDSLGLNEETFELSDNGSKGGVHMFERAILADIGGYDEFYSLWGYEDNDLFLRLEQLGVKTEWLDPTIAPVFH